jgi:hypothetical protein
MIKMKEVGVAEMLMFHPSKAANQVFFIFLLLDFAFTAHQKGDMNGIVCVGTGIPPKFVSIRRFIRFIRFIHFGRRSISEIRQQRLPWNQWRKRTRLVERNNTQHGKI